MDRVVWNSWHKFIYYDDIDKNKILDDLSKYKASLNSNEPIVVYICDDGLSMVNENIQVDRYRIEFFHHRYYELLITLSIIDKLIESIDIDVLNSRFKRLFHLCSLSGNTDITDILLLRDMLNKSKDIYKREYINYIETGILRNFYDSLEISSVVIDSVIPCIKKSIGLDKYFSLVIDVNDEISKYNEMSINDYIASRCTSYLSVNILLSKYEWKFYYSSNGQFIQDVHDYSEIDLRKNKIKSRYI